MIYIVGNLNGAYGGRKSRRANKHAIQAGKYDQAPRRSHMFTDREIS